MAAKHITTVIKHLIIQKKYVSSKEEHSLDGFVKEVN